MMKIRISLVASLFILAFLPTAEAQEEGTTFYMHGMVEYWDNDTPPYLAYSVPTGPDSTITNQGSAGPDPFTLTAKMTVPEDLSLGAGPAQATGYLKSFQNGPAPQTKLEFIISVDGTQVASGSGVEDVLLGNIVKYDFDLDFTGGEISAGQELSLQFLVSDDTTGGYNPLAYVRSGGESPWSFTLPLSKPLPPPPAEVLTAQFEDVDADSLLLDFAYPEAATQEWTYNWTNENPVGNITLRAEILQGSAQFVVIDAFNDTLFDATLEATFEQNATFDGFEGNWTVRAVFTDFVGNATMAVMPDLPASPDASENPTGTGSQSGSSSASSSSQSGSTFEGGNAKESNDSPGVPILLALLGLAFVALRRRA